MSLLNCLCAAIPARERVITCEEVFELWVLRPDVVAMQTSHPDLEGAGENPAALVGQRRSRALHGLCLALPTVGFPAGHGCAPFGKRARPAPRT